MNVEVVKKRWDAYTQTWGSITADASGQAEYRLGERLVSSEVFYTEIALREVERNAYAHTIIPELIKEVERYERERVEVQNQTRVITCAFCGYAYHPGTPASNNSALAEHIPKCEKHPVGIELRRLRDGVRASALAFRSRSAAETDTLSIGFANGQREAADALEKLLE